MNLAKCQTINDTKVLFNRVVIFMQLPIKILPTKFLLSHEHRRLLGLWRGDQFKKSFDMSYLLSS